MTRCTFEALVLNGDILSVALTDIVVGTWALRENLATDTVTKNGSVGGLQYLTYGDKESHNH